MRGFSLPTQLAAGLALALFCTSPARCANPSGNMASDCSPCDPVQCPAPKVIVHMSPPEVIFRQCAPPTCSEKPNKCRTTWGRSCSKPDCEAPAPLQYTMPAQQYQVQMLAPQAVPMTMATQAVPVTFAAQPIQQVQVQTIQAFQPQAFAVQAAPQAFAFQNVQQGIPTVGTQAFQPFSFPASPQSAPLQDAELRSLLALVQRMHAAEAARTSAVSPQATPSSSGECPKACDDQIKSHEARIANLEVAINKLTTQINSLTDSVTKLAGGK